MISNLTLQEIKEFFEGDLINRLSDDRYYTEKCKTANMYRVRDIEGKFQGYVMGR